MFILLFVARFSVSFSVEVHFESPDTGFFLKHSPRQNTLLSTATTVSSNSKARLMNDSILSIDRFTVVQTSQPVSIRASYGPFSTKQTVPARYIVPDVLETINADSGLQNATISLIDLQQSNPHLDISAHVVKNIIVRDSPVLRVLFHAGADPRGHLQRQKICVLLHASMGNKAPLKGRCMPEGEDGVCVAEVVIPANWWPPMPSPDIDGRYPVVTPPKSPQRVVQVSYSVFEPPVRNPELCEPKVQIQPLTPFAKIPLLQSHLPYKELRADDTLTMMVPQQPLYPLSKIHVPVFLHPEPEQSIAVFIVRARVKAGMRILGATASSDEWNVSVEKENTKHTVARVTAFRKDQDPDSPVGMVRTGDNRALEVFSWMLEVANDTKEHLDGGRIIWSVSYVHDGPKIKDLSAESIATTSTAAHEEGKKKIVAKLDIQKDDIQAVLPIAKNWELMNTAVLTGRQVSQAMKVFIVSQAGKVADVTLQSSCLVEDESVIKVSSSCSSVYVDGSEIGGSSNASVVVKYGTYTGLARFTVWMPEFPLEVSVADFRLSQIKNWKIPDDHITMNSKTKRRKKRAYNGGWEHHVDDFANGPDRSTCRARYQQSQVEVYARFLAVDQDSGRVSYLISRRTGLRVTDLVQPLLRVADPKIATLRGRTLQGRAMGRTDVQVLSPINGRVIGAREVRVGSDKVTITKLLVKVVSGLQLSISSDPSIENGYIAETSVTRKLTAQYQEGLLDIDLEFSDGSKTPLRDISVDDYFLLVESLDTEVVAFAPMLASHHPRVIAVGEGNGNLLRVTLLLSEECRLRRNLPVSKQGIKASFGPLVSALASVQVDFSGLDISSRPDTVQNDGIIGRDRVKSGNELNDLEEILIGIPIKHNSRHGIEAALQPSKQYNRGNIIVPGGSLGKGGSLTSNKSIVHDDATTLEIGMYVVLTVFCLAIAVFVVSCVVYASKYRPVTIDVNGEASIHDAMGNASVSDVGKGSESCATNVHDWVWLGRATMDRSNAESALESGNYRDSRMHIISNPMNSKYGDADASIIHANSFDNPNHVQLPPSANILTHNVRVINGLFGKGETFMPINSSTYNKRDRHNDSIVEEAPPLPPHATTALVDRSEYRPPVPPHRNANNSINITNRQFPFDTVMQSEIKKRNQIRHEGRNNGTRMSDKNGSVTNPAYEIRMPNALLVERHNLRHTQHKINAALFSNGGQEQLKHQSHRVAMLASNSSPNSFENMGFSVVSAPHSSIADRREQRRLGKDLHMAERLVNQQNDQQTAFKFDTIKHQVPADNQQALPYSKSSSSPCRNATKKHEVIVAAKEQSIQEGKNNYSDTSQCNDESSSNQNKCHTSFDDNGGFVTPSSDRRYASNRVRGIIQRGNSASAAPTNGSEMANEVIRKPSVVGNPMFSSTPDSELGPGESLGLDDLDMDYEQIMHYFDNLKESNA
ncbi:transmembrane protein 132D [Anopheles cruzii]|uniref:transmembrane protein 132D n=1 Tax=Anopheles cruzii TaxID=68878 RepID=UPI0022EC4ABB|nr:transmembrane protein 132D [Anopheles cruzii]